MFLRSLLIALLSFSCQPSRKNEWLCCSVRSAVAQAQFSCPLPGQRPVRAADGSNQFCSRPGQRDDCPQMSLCLSSGNSPNLYICCYSAAFQVTPICPNNGIPQPAPYGEKYKSCSVLGDCDSGFSCVRSANDYSTSLCCTTGVLQEQRPVCPRQGQLLTERGKPVYCVRSQPQLCPQDYSCQQALGNPGTYVCCSSSLDSCPASHKAVIDAEGNQISCSPTNLTDCPGGTQCMQSTRDSRMHLCCSGEETPRVCPRSQKALLTSTGSVEICNSPGLPCYQDDYTCQWSASLSQYVCCGRDVAAAYCADGRSTYEQIEGQTYSCNPLGYPSSCPSGYTCELSTAPGINVCCKTPVTTTAPALPPITTLPVITPRPPLSMNGLQCPDGWNPYRNDIGFHTRTCSGVFDMSCPVGYSCTPSKSGGNFVCCRLASSLRCLNGDTFLSNTFPRLCNRYRTNECPRGYTCQESSHPTISVCCSSDLPLNREMCMNGREPALMNGFVRSCPREGSTGGCPPGHTCQKAVSGLLVCCSSSYSRSEVKSIAPTVCPKSRQPLISPVTNEVVYCDHTAYICPDGKACLPQVKSDRYVCCSEVPKCPDGETEAYSGGELKKCSSFADCSPGNVCKPSTVDGVHLCCSSGAIPVGEVLTAPAKTAIANVNGEDWVVIEG